MFCDKNVFFLLDVPVNDKRNGEIREGENKNCEGGFVFRLRNSYHSTSPIEKLSGCFPLKSLK